MSTSTTSRPRARPALTASKLTAAGSPPCWLMISTVLRSAQMASCSRAAARKVSAAASRTVAPELARWLVSLPIEVVLPAPLTPATMITVGRCSPMTSGSLQRHQQRGDGLGQQALDGARVGGFGFLHAALEIGQQVVRGLHAGVGQQQGGFQFFVERVVDLRAGEHRGDAGAGLAQAELELVQPAFALGRGCGGGRQSLGRRGHHDFGWRRHGRGWVRATVPGPASACALSHCRAREPEPAAVPPARPVRRRPPAGPAALRVGRSLCRRDRYRDDGHRGCGRVAGRIGQRHGRHGRNRGLFLEKTEHLWISGISPIL